MPTKVKGNLLEFSERMTASMKLREFQGMSARAVLDILAEVAEKAKEYAAENVAPDKGPGPHPHRTDYGFVYQDTGDLGSNIGIKRVPDGVFVHAYIYTPFDYGAYLEIGWKGPSGKIFRYPWLRPAWERAQKEFPNVARTRLKRALSDSTKGRRAGVLMNERDIAKFIADTDEYNRVLAANQGDDRALNALISESLESVGSHKEYMKSILTVSRRATQQLARKRRHQGDVKLKKPTVAKTKTPAQTNQPTPHVSARQKSFEDQIRQDIEEARRRKQGNKE